MPDQEPTHGTTTALAPARSRGGPITGDDAAAGLAPLGLGHRRPHPVAVAARAAWRSRGELRATWDVLSRAVCDGCSLGPRGLWDDAGPGLHICSRRLARLHTHDLPLLAPADLLDIRRLRRLDDAALRDLGRLPQPFVYRPGDRGFLGLSWDTALDMLAERVRAAPPEGRSLLLHPAGQVAETSFSLSQAAGTLEFGHAALCRPAGHAAADQALRTTLGVSGATCSLSDLGQTDLVLIIGADPSQHQPALMRTLAQAKRRGARIVVVDIGRPRGLEAAWTLAGPRSSVFGSLIMDDLVQVQPGGDLAFLTAVLQILIKQQAVSGPYVDRHTRGFAPLAAALGALDPQQLERESGVSRARVAWVAELLARARSCVSIFGTGLARSLAAGPAVTALAHIHLARGLLGWPGMGILPLHDSEGTQAARDFGLAGHVGEVLERDPAVLWAVGDDLLAGLSDPARVTEGLGRAGTRIHQVTTLSRAHLVEPSQELLLLPALTRYDQPGGALVTSVERRVRLSPQIHDQPDGQAQPGWWIANQLVSRVRPDLRDRTANIDIRALRRAIEVEIPAYAGVAALRTAGDHLQVGGPQLCRDGFDGLPDRRAPFDLGVLPAAVAE